MNMRDGSTGIEKLEDLEHHAMVELVRHNFIFCHFMARVNGGYMSNREVCCGMPTRVRTP